MKKFRPHEYIEKHAVMNLTVTTELDAADGAPLHPGRGTLVVVAANVVLTKAQAIKIAEMADDGLARSIRHVHSAYDAVSSITDHTVAKGASIAIEAAGRCVATDGPQR